MYYALKKKNGISSMQCNMIASMILAIENRHGIIKKFYTWANESKVHDLDI